MKLTTKSGVGVISNDRQGVRALGPEPCGPGCPGSVATMARGIYQRGVRGYHCRHTPTPSHVPSSPSCELPTSYVASSAWLWVSKLLSIIDAVATGRTHLEVLTLPNMGQTLDRAYLS